MTARPDSRFGALLKAARVAAGLTQEVLAERAHLSTRGLQDLDRGVNQAPRRETVALLVTALSLAGQERAAFEAAAAPLPRRPSREMPPGPSATPHPGALPTLVTALLGRAHEVAAADLLRREEVRLLTLTGPGGVGKTRLAVQVARALDEHFADGVVFVDLAPLHEARLVPAALAQALGVVERGDRPLREALVAHLCARQVLLLDNAEHLLAADEVAVLRAACPGLRLLVTSRVALHLRGEQVYPVPPLALPAPGESLPPEVLSQIPAVALFPRLAVFAGGCTLEAAEAVCLSNERQQPDVVPCLAALVEASPLVAEENARGEPRYRMLETVQEFAREQLETAEPLVRDRHLSWCLALAEEATSQLRGPEAGSRMGRLEAEHDNLRAALGWARESGALVPGLRLAGALQRFWEVGGHLSEGRIWLEGLLTGTGAHPSDAAAAAARATALNGAGNLARGQGRYAEAQALIEESLALHRGLGDREGVAYALFRLGTVVRARGDYAGALAIYEECHALYRALGDRAVAAFVLLGLGDIARDEGAAERVEAYCTQSLSICQELGHHWCSGFSLNNLALAAAMRGELARAQALAEEALVLFRTHGIQGGVVEMLIILGRREESNRDYCPCLRTGL